MKNQGCSSNTADASCEKSKCYAKFLKGALIGGLVMFVYLAVSWMVLPWHKNTMQSFKNNNAVASVLAANADKSGIYILSQTQQKVPKSKKTVDAPSKPYAFVSVLSSGVDTGRMRASLTATLLLCLFNAALLTGLLKRGSCCGGCPIMFSASLGLLIGAAGHLPGLIWYHFPLNFTLLGMVDDVLAFTLAGAAISKLVLKTGSCSTTPKGNSGGSCSMKG